MSFASRLFRTVISTVVVVGLSLAMAQSLMPPGQSIRDLPSVMAMIRERTPNPFARSIFDLIVSDEERQKAAAKLNAQRELANPIYDLGEQTGINVTSRTLGVVDGTAFDPKAFEEIDKMLIPDHMKAELKKNYLRTGQIKGLTFESHTEEEAQDGPIVRNEPTLIWPTRSLQALVAVTAGATTDEPRPALPNKDLEAQADTLFAKIHSEAAEDQTEIVNTAVSERRMVDSARSLLKTVETTAISADASSTSEVSTENL